ncbi:MAG: radical SAM protein [Planctomycetes bacterium]|nr:radical SAM protein [Planctomycetota bacterium]
MAEPIRAFLSHPRSHERNLYVYPVLSRRARGLSLGVNLSPHKACNMDCVYCQVDRTVPGATGTVDLEVVERELRDLLSRAVSGEIFAEEPFRPAPERLRRLADVAFSGDGEPTSFRGFPEACLRVVRVKETCGVPDLPVRIITNAIDLDREEVREALRFLDGRGGEVWAKLDAGTEEHFRRVARTATPFAKILRNITETARERPVVIQSLFCRLDGAPPPGAEIDAWLGRLGDILGGGGRIDLVQVYTTARPPAERFVSPLSLEELEGIAARVRSALGLRADAYGPG